MSPRRSRPKNKRAVRPLKYLEKFAPDRFEDGHLDPRYALDPGIRHYVLILRSKGIETCQSCQGGPGHAYLEPTIEFYGDKSAGSNAVAAAFTYNLPVADLRREWNIRNGEMIGPIWTITFTLRADLWLKREAAPGLRPISNVRKPGGTHVSQAFCNHRNADAHLCRPCDATT